MTTTSTTQLFADSMVVESLILEGGTEGGVVGTVTPAPDSVPKSYPTGKLDPGWLPAVTPAGIGAASESTQVIAGTGLAGGGTLASNVTLSVKYGKTADAACVGNDARLSDTRIPTPHATSHLPGGTDVITPAALGAVPTTDSRLSDSRTPKAHAASHASDGADAISTLGPVAEKSQALGTISGSVTINLSAGLSVSATIGGATTLAFTGVPTGGAAVVVLTLTNGGSATVTWPTTIAWASSKAPTLTASGKDMIVLATSDGGMTWMGSASLKYGSA